MHRRGRRINLHRSAHWPECAAEAGLEGFQFHDLRHTGTTLAASSEYEGGVTASFTATAFTGYQFRKTRLFGTHGCIEGDGKVLDLLDFGTRRREWVPIPTVDVPKGLEGHGGGDAGLIRAFLDALVSGDPAAHLPDPRQALAAHHLTWAAEQARLTASVVDLLGAPRPAPPATASPMHEQAGSRLSELAENAAGRPRQRNPSRSADGCGAG